MNIVAKFGGSSVAMADNIAVVRNIILNDKDRKYIVVSAPGKRYKEDSKITDLLIASFESAVLDNEVVNRFRDIVRGLNIKYDLDNDLDYLTKTIKSHNYNESILSGEFIIAKIIAHYIGYQVVDAADYIVFSDGKVDIMASVKRLKNLPKYCVIPGFYGGDSNNGKKILFDRGGGDITGAIIARGTNSQIYENWTDVDGVFDSDPNINKEAKKINYITYNDMYNLSLSGATVLHPYSITPIKNTQIITHVRNSFKSNQVGTIIAKKLKNSFLYSNS